MTDNKIPLFSEELAKASQQAEQANQDASATPLPSDVENTEETAPYNYTQKPSVASVEASDGEKSDIVVPVRPQGEEPGEATTPIVETTQPTQPNDTKPKAEQPKAKPAKYPIAYNDDDLKKAYGLLTEDERQGINLDTDEGKASMSAMVDRLKLPNRLVVGADGKTQRVYLPYDPDDTSSEAYTQSQKPIEVIGTEGKRGGEKLGIPLAEIMDNPSSVRWQFGDTTITGMQPITGGVTQAKVKDLESASYTSDGKPILTFKTSDGQTQKVILNATKADVDKARSERNAVAEIDLRSKEALLQARQSDIDAKLSKAMQAEGYTTPDVTKGVDDGNSLSSLVRLYLLPRINPKTAALANAYDTNKATLDKIQAIKTNIANGNTSSGMIDDVLKSGSEVLGGFLSKVSKASTWDNGVSELSIATYGKKAYDKYMAGGKLTDDEQAMLDAIGYSLYFDEAYKDNLHNANLGAGVAESLPYAINIAIAGWTGAGKTAGKLAETSITKALKSRLLKRYGEKAIARWLPNIASKATSAMTEAGVATGVGGLKQEADALQRMTGDVDTSTIDASGHATYNKDSKVDGGGVAHYKAFGAGLIENLSEMAEPYIAMIPRGVKSVVSNKMASLAKKSGTFNTLYDAMASLKPSQLSQVLDAGLRKGKINGLFEEVAGEVAGNIANAALIGDMSFTIDKESPDWQNSVFNPDVNADIVAQCAIMSYGFRVPGAIADATYNAHKAASSVRTNIMGKKAFGDKWQDVKATIDAMSPEDAVEFASNAVKEQSDGCEAVYRYAIQSKGEQLANNIQANKDDNNNDITDVAHETAVKAVDAPITEARQAVKAAQESSQEMPNSLKVSINALVDNDASDGEVKSLFDQLSDAERPMAEQYYLAQVQLKGHEVGATAIADAETEQFADAVSDMSTEVDGNAVVMTADVDGEQKVIKSKGDTMTILADGTAVTSDKVTDVKTSPVEDIVESHRSQALQSEMDKLDFAKSHNPNTINPNSGDVVMGADGNQYVYSEATTTNSDGIQVTQTCLYPAIPSEDGGIVADTKQPLLQGISKDEVLAMQDRYYDNLDNNATEVTTRNEEATDATDDATQDATESVEDNTTDEETNANDTTPNDGQQTEESVETPNEEQSIDQGNNQTEVSQEQENTQPKDVNVTDAPKIADTYVSKISKAKASKSDSVRRNADKLVSAFAKKAKASSTTDLGAMVSRLASQTDNDTAIELLDIANKELQSRKSARRGKANEAPQSDNDVQERLAEAESETDTEPTEAQKKAGNYKKGHFNIDGYDVSIENPKGSVRSGTDANGKKWEQKMNNTYGYIRGTEGVDGDHIDVFFSDDPSQGDVFVVDQVNNDGTFDEHKVMYGFASVEEARKAYLSNYEDGWQGLGAITHVSKEEFKKWVESSHRKTKPFAEYKNVNAVEGNAEDTTQATESPITEEAYSHLAESEQKAKERMKYLTPSQVARLMRIGKVAKSMGLGIRFVDTMEDNGLYDPNTNTITIALDAENPIEVVFGHEVTHGLRRQSEEAYQSLRNAVMATIPSDAFKARVASTKSLYESAGQKGNDEYYEEEAVCDLVGELVGKSDILSHLKRNADYKVLGWMHSVAKSIMGVLRRGDKEYQKFSQAKKAFRQAYLDAVNREKGNATDTNVEQRKSIRQSAEEAVSAYKEEAERPKPLMSAIRHSIRGGKRNVPIDPFVEGWDSIISSDAFKLEETLFDSLKAIEEFQRYMTGSKDVPDYLNAHRALMVLSSVNKAQMDMFAGTYVENLRKAIEEMVGTAEMNKGFYAEDGALAELDRFLKAQHGLERNRDMRVRAKLSEIYNEKIAEAQVVYNQTQDKEAYNDVVKKAQEEYNVSLEEFYAKRDEIVAEGLEAGDNWYLINTKLDDYVIDTFFKTDKVDARDLTLSEINALKAKRDELLERAKNEQWSARRLQEALDKMLSDESFKSITGNKKMVSLPATKEYYDELAGLTGMFSWGNTPLGVYLANEEAKQFVSWYKGTENKESLDAVEKAIADINDFSLKKQKESGLVDEEYVKEQKRRYLNFVPLRDFMDVSSDDMYDYLTGQSGIGGNPVKTAKGRHSEAGPAIAGLINVANRSITAGNRNLALQKMYNIVKAKGVNTLANARNRWIVRDNEDTNKWHDAEPEISPDATAEQVTTQLEEFENNMKSLEEQGLARRVDGKRSPSEYRIMSRRQMDEHKIKVAIGGRQYIIDFLGNPRAAQAANGMTNPDVSDDAGRTLFRTFKNFLASAFTSKNIAFSVANFFRDTEHSNNYVFIKEGGEYYRRFTERQLNKFKYRSYMTEIFSKLKMFREGKLSEDDTFYQFMNNGGATGYTFVQSQEEEAEKFVKELVEAKNGNWGKKMWNRFFDMVEYMGNVSELTNRYIAFITSREMGRSIGRSIEDAKEVTLNFNRKGSGTKTKIDGLLPKYIPSVVEYGQRYILFFNANVQAKRQLLYMLKENPAKTTGARIGRAAFYRMMIPAIFAGVFLPAINDILLPAIYSALGFDDDDDEEKYDYFNKLGDYERTHSINFALPNNAFLSIPVSPDIAPFMSIGDVISAQMQNKRDMTLKDFIEAGSDIISPININYGSEDDINWTASAMSFFPSQMRPIGDIFVNTNFMGQPVYKGGGIGNRQYTPEFKKGMRRTSPALTAWSKFVNDMSGGDDVEKGAMDGLFNNPAVMEHLLKGYLGGYGTATLDMVINPLYNSLTGDFKDLSLKAEQLPLVGRFYKGGSRDEQMRRMERTFRNEVYERNAETRAQESELKKEAMKANREGQLYRLAELRNKYIQLVQSDKYKKYYATKQASEAISDQLKLTSTMTDNEKRYLIDMMRRTIGIYRGEIKIYGTPSEDNQ